MPKTKQKLAEEVLLELGRADAANPAESAEDIDLVKRRYEGVLSELEDSDLVFWDEDAIPTRVFAPLAKLIATECAQAFGTGAGDTDDLKDHGVVNALSDIDDVPPTEVLRPPVLQVREAGRGFSPEFK